MQPRFLFCLAGAIAIVGCNEKPEPPSAPAVPAVHTSDAAAWSGWRRTTSIDAAPAREPAFWVRELSARDTDDSYPETLLHLEASGTNVVLRWWASRPCGQKASPFSSISEPDESGRRVLSVRAEYSGSARRCAEWTAWVIETSFSDLEPGDYQLQLGKRSLSFRLPAGLQKKGRRPPKALVLGDLPW